MIEIQLTGSATATAAGLSVTTNTRKGPIGPLCRKLLTEGYSADEIVTVHRNGQPIFKAARLAAWADYDFLDLDVEGLKRRPWKPFSATAQASLARSVNQEPETV